MHPPIVSASLIARMRHWAKHETNDLMLAVTLDGKRSMAFFKDQIDAAATDAELEQMLIERAESKV